ncbi:reverse transcriptase-rnase h-integrase [Moniliophthora roreri MCA 2997]|uniref:Reverse transcriptase-rnase h-integrase n=2 Tax=Moniliophthora roreri TaxID=221103 RepID=V2X4Y5_MONRO|nr:reverse transcriptase-rnase h-integrase [Moniliophthora roreri MCA 2997]
MASPFFFVAKKEKGALQPTQDYQELNKGTIKNAYPLPLISDLLDKLKGAEIFTKLDLRNSYNNVRIKDGDQWKAAFKMNRGLFEPTVMFFGLSNSPATFQNFMNDILSDFIDEGWCVVYMDDILLFSKNQEEHRERTERLMRQIRKHDLYFKPEKCEFDVQQVVFLGMVIRPNYVAMDPVKLAGIVEWELLKTVKGVQAFLGFGNFYRKFISKYAQLARPLHDLTRKSQKFEWMPTCQIAFDLLKRKFLSEPILLMPDSDKPFVIEADALKWATGAVLRQQGPDGQWHPCGYLSKSFSLTERNYEIYDRELLAIMRALTEWRHYLMGGKYKVVVLSDHKNLMYFRVAQKLNRRQARWSLLLSEFDLSLVHMPRTSMTQADALS